MLSTESQKIKPQEIAMLTLLFFLFFFILAPFPEAFDLT